MSQIGRTIAKNAGALMGSQVITWALSLLLTLFMSRYLGPSGIGEYRLAGAIWLVMGVLISFGMDTLLVKEVARDPEKTAALFSTTIVLRGVLFAISCGVVAIYIHLRQAPTSFIYLVIIVGLAHIVSQAVNASIAALQGLEIMEYVSISNIIGQ